MKSRIPLVTVAMPVFNAGTHLRSAVLSIVQQSFEDWELLLLDDGSTDDALTSIQDIADERIQVVRDGTNRGISVRLNQAIAMSRGTYFARMDSDDISYPHRLAHQLIALQRDATLDLLATRAIVIDENDAVVGLFPYARSHADICATPWRSFHLPHPTWMGKTRWFRQHGYQIPAPYCCEDQELLLRSHSRSTFDTLDDVLFAYRIRSRADLPKLVRTSRAMWGMQRQHFQENRQWLSLLRSTMVLGTRIIYYTALQVARREPLRLAEISPKQRTDWDTVLTGIKQ